MGDIMNFGLWDNSIHADSEQLKRIATAKKADTTPSTIDHENKTAEFKGSGKSPYITTLDSCSCRDFFVRKLPCKHIYRLALELNGADVQQGTNKNELTYSELPFDIFAFPVESQEMLYDMCVANIYHGENTYMLERNEFSEMLFYKGFCVQNVPTAEMISAFPVSKMKLVLYASDICLEDLPKKTAQRKSVVACIEKYYESVAAFVDKHFIYLEFTEHTDKAKTAIHRRLAKIYGACNPRDDDFVIEIRLNVGDTETPSTVSIESYRKN